MTDSRFNYERVNVIKIIIQSKSGKVLLLQEPETNEWMPLHWGFPGGKPLQNESLIETCKRKAEKDLGIEIQPEGLITIKELLQVEKTIVIYHILAKSEDEFIPHGEAKDYKWVSKTDVENMQIEDFTEFFNKKLLLNFLNGEVQVAPVSLIETENYNKLIGSKDLEYEKWFNSGKK